METAGNVKTQHDVELLGQAIDSQFNSLPANLRLLIIMDPRSFDEMSEGVPGMKGTDRFIYQTQAGVEFGIKKGE